MTGHHHQAGEPDPYVSHENYRLLLVRREARCRVARSVRRVCPRAARCSCRGRLRGVWLDYLAALVVAGVATAGGWSDAA
jgi:hypothetical protein